MLNLQSLNYEEFSQYTVARSADDDCQPSGCIAVVLPSGMCGVSRFSHCSCNGTHYSLGGENGMLCYDWTGSFKEMLYMAVRKTDLVVSGRPLNPEDYDYMHVNAVFEQLCEKYSFECNLIKEELGKAL